MLARIAGEAGSDGEAGTRSGPSRRLPGGWRVLSRTAAAAGRGRPRGDHDATSCTRSPPPRSPSPTARPRTFRGPGLQRRSRRHGYRCHGTVIEVATPTTRRSWSTRSPRSSRRAGSTIERLLHPVVGTVRDGEGRIERVRVGPRGRAPRVVHALRGRPPARRRVNARAERTVAGSCATSRLVVRDFDPMQERVRHMVDMARAAEVRYPPRR